MYTKNPALYIHIPFCVSKCTYCDFFSIKNNFIPDEYVNALKKELKYKISYYKIDKFYSVYFGGGTPSLLNKTQIEDLVKNILPYTNENTEINFECNCDDINEDFLFFLKTVGINRVSVGVQTFNKKSLTCIKRRASQEQTLKAVKILSNFYSKYHDEFKISLDFISGLPFSTEKTIIEDLKIAVENKFPHISLYALTLEEKTPLYKDIEEDKIFYDESLASEQWIMGRDFLLNNGYQEYEISNFAFSGYESLHNSFYWKEKDYLGIGSGAVETIFAPDGKSGIRKTNTMNIEKYIETSPFNQAEIENLNFKTVYLEYLMTGFRTSKGVNSNDFYNRFGIKLEDVIKDKFKKYVNLSKAKIENNNFYFLPDGMLFLNQFLVDIF